MVMRFVFLAIVAVVVGSVGCSSAPEPETQPEPAETPEAEVAPPALTPMIVLRPSRGVEFGDTVSVDIGGIDEDGRMPRYVGGRAVGTLSANDLGPVGTGKMVVTASRLNVHRCRSTGCSVLGYVVRDQEVEASEFAGRWYRVRIDEGTTGYVMAEHLQLPLVGQRSALADIRRRTADYYKNELQPIELDGAQVFTGYDVRADDEMLNFVFKARGEDGEALALVCNAMRGIAEFVRESMASYPPQHFPVYSAGVYPDSSDGSKGEEMIAGLSGDDGVYCRSPQ
jgi:hypothetical protein